MQNKINRLDIKKTVIEGKRTHKERERERERARERERERE